MTFESLLQPATLLTVAVRGVALLLVAAFLVRMAGKASAASRHLIWSLAMAALLVLPLLSATLPSLQVQGPRWLGDSWASLSQERSPRSRAAAEQQAPAPWGTVSFATPPAPAATSPSTTSSESDAGPAATPPQAAQLAPLQVSPQVFVGIDPTAPTASGRVRAAETQAVSPAATTRSAAFGWLLPLWLVGLVGIAGWFALQHGSVRWLTMHAVEVDEGELVDRMHRLRQHIGLRRPVRLLLGHRTMMPMTWGVFRPVVLLPDNVSDWPVKRQENVLLHELAHIQRRDHLTQVLAQISCALHWFNPLTWYAVRRMTLEREHACDDYVLNSGTLPSDYATNLLEVARSMKRGPVTSMAAIAMAGRSTLKDRLQAVLDQGRRRNTLGGRLAAVSLLLVMAVALPLATLEIVSVDPAMAVGPKASKHGHHDGYVHGEPDGDHHGHGYSYGYSYDDGDGDIFVSGDPMVLYHNGERIELPYIAGDEIMAILGKQLQGQNWDEVSDVLESLGGQLGDAFRELQVDEDTPFRFYAFSEEAQDAVRQQLENLRGSLGDLRVIQGTGSGYVSLHDNDVVPRAPRAPRPPRPPRPPVVVAPDIDVRPFAIAGNNFRVSSRGRNNWTWNDNGDRMSLRTRGTVTFNAEGTDVESLSPDGYFEFESEEGRNDYRVRIRNDRDGEIERTWWVDGDERPYDDEARAWMARTMPELMRRTGFNAEERVGSILEKQGVDGVLKEIEELDSDHVSRLYFGELFEQGKLDAKQYEKVFDTAARSIRSDFELATLLAQLAKATNLDDNAIVAYARASREINSDFEQRRALTALVEEQRLSAQSLQAVLDAAKEIGSDFELASFLSELGKDHPEAYQSPAFYEALDSVGSDFEQRRVLNSVVKERDLSAENLALALQMAADGIDSDFELAELLSTAARTHDIEGKAVDAFLEALGTINSDFEFRRASTALVRRGNLKPDAVQKLVTLAGKEVNSDFELSELLQTVAEHYEIEGDLREAYLDASETISSSHENSRALAAIHQRPR